jgi:hypothetical protein
MPEVEMWLTLAMPVASIFRQEILAATAPV